MSSPAQENEFPGKAQRGNSSAASPDPAAVNSMFGRIAGRYDLANHLLSCGVDYAWRRRLTREVAAEKPRDVLDLATGSGDVAFALRRKLSEKVRIVGLDFCQPMLDEAEKKQADVAAAEKIEFLQGDILQLPFPDSSFDAITIAFGLRNLADRHQGLGEMCRVLRRNGRVFILEFTQPPKVVRPFYYFYLKRILPRIAGRVTGDRDAYEYLNNTIAAFPDRAGITGEMARAGFENIRARSLTGGIVALHVGQAAS